MRRIHGRSAHSSVPATGINALTAVRAAFANVDLMHPTFQFQDTINGIIREGGTANNVIPERASCEFCLRSRTLGNLERLVDIVKRCAEAAALLTGARAEVSVDPLFSERYPNIPMGEAFKRNLESLGEPVAYADPMGAYGSSDVSNLSLYMPVIHEYISIAAAGGQRPFSGVHGGSCVACGGQGLPAWSQGSGYDGHAPISECGISGGDTGGI